MKKLKTLIQIFLFIIILLFCNKVKAASVTLSSNPSSVSVGEEFTVSMNLSGTSLASLNVKITVDTSKVEYISSNASSNTNFNNGKILYTWTDTSGGSNPKTNGTIATFRLKAKTAGTAVFNISGNFYDTDENSVNMSLSGTSVTIKEITPVTPPEEPETPNTNTTEPEQPDVPPTNTENPDVPPENPETPEVPNNPTNPETPTIPDNPNTPNEPEHNDQYEIEENPQPSDNNNLSSNVYLKSLQVNVEGISPRFNRNTTKYYLIVDNTVDAITVNAIPEDSNSRVEVTGNQDLQIGNNTITITVTAQNGDTRNYIISVTKTNDPNNANTNLENLAIENVMLNPTFDTNILEYTANVGSQIETLNILAVPEIEGASVKITGGDRLTFGNNLISIAVTAKDGTSVKIYTINVYKMTETEENEVQNELLEENNNINEDINNGIISNRSDNIEKNKKGNVWLWILFWILIVVIISIVGYLVRDLKKKKG